MPWRRASLLLALAAAACMQLVLLAAAVNAQVVVLDACSWVHWEDYEREQPIVTYDGSSTAYCPNDITTGCKQRCKKAIQRVGAATAVLAHCILSRAHSLCVHHCCCPAAGLRVCELPEVARVGLSPVAAAPPRLCPAPPRPTSAPPCQLSGNAMMQPTQVTRQPSATHVPTCRDASSYSCDIPFEEVGSSVPAAAARASIFSKRHIGY